MLGLRASTQRLAGAGHGLVPGLLPVPPRVVHGERAVRRVGHARKHAMGRAGSETEGWHGRGKLCCGRGAPVHRLLRQRVRVVPRKVRLADDKVVVRVQLPELAVQHVKVLVTQVAVHQIDVLLLVRVRERVHKARVANVAGAQTAAAAAVRDHKDARNHRAGIFFLEFGRRVQELEARVVGE